MSDCRVCLTAVVTKLELVTPAEALAAREVVGCHLLLHNDTY